jgi:hypothetical protein
MAGSFDVHIVDLTLGEFVGATEVPLVQVPTYGGGITVLSAHLVGGGTVYAGTTVGGKIVTMSNQGTPAINGTVGAFAGTVITAAGVVAALTVSSAFVANGYWLGFDQTSGTIPAGSHIALSYVMGK